MIKFKFFLSIVVVLLISLSCNFLLFKKCSSYRSSLVECKTQLSFVINESESLNQSVLRLSHENSVLLSKLDSLKSIITMKALNSKSRKIKIHF